MGKIVAFGFLIVLTHFYVYEIIVRRKRLNKKISSYIIPQDNSVRRGHWWSILIDKYCIYVNKKISMDKIIKEKEQKRLYELLVQAGFNKNNNVLLLLSVKLFSSILLCIFLYILNYGSGNEAVWGFMGLATGILGPEMMLRRIREKRMSEINQNLPDAIELMVISTNVGLNIDSTLERVEREFADLAPMLSSEISLTRSEIKILQSREKAFKNLALRIPLKSLESLSMNLIQSEKMGRPLSQTLMVISSEAKRNALMDMEEKIGKIPAKMGLPLIIFILFPLVVLLGGPSMIQLIRQLNSM